jgi:alpha/beta superfamily hydrolase
MTPADVLKDLDKALARFGTYDYYDKGVDEVFDASKATSYVRSLEPADAVRFLVSLSNHEHGSHLVSHIVNCLDDTPEEWFEVVVEECREAGLDVY